MQIEEMLYSLLPGLEAAKKAIETEITEIHQKISELRMQAAQAPVAAPQITQVPPLPPPPKKRNTSEELKAKRRELLAKARIAKINGLRAAKGLPPVEEKSTASEVPHSAGHSTRDGTGRGQAA